MTYKDISIKQYLALTELAEEADNRDMLSLQVGEIAIIFNMTEDDVLSLPLPEYQKKVKEIQFLSTPPKRNPHRISKIKINGKPYDVATDVRKLTAGQFIDYNTFVKMKDDKYLPHIISVFVTPEGKKYGDYDMDAHIEEVSCLDLQTALDLSFFFLSKYQDWLKSMILCLGWQIKKVKNPETKKTLMNQLDSLKSGLGYITQI